MYQAPDGSLTIETWADARDGLEITLKAHMLCLEHYSYRTGKEFVGCVHDFRPSAAQMDDYRAGFRSMWGLDSRVSEDRHDGLCLRALPGLRVSVGKDCTRH